MLMSHAKCGKEYPESSGWFRNTPIQSETKKNLQSTGVTETTFSLIQAVNVGGQL